MKLLNKNEIIIKKSKFIAYYYDIDSLEDVKKIISNLKEEHKKASHLPYAYKFLQTAGKTDDKEPNGTAGLPILNILERKKLSNKLIVVIRYFGGTKLGFGNLYRAYLTASKNVIND